MPNKKKKKKKSKKEAINNNYIQFNPKKKNVGNFVQIFLPTFLSHQGRLCFGGGGEKTCGPHQNLSFFFFLSFFLFSIINQTTKNIIFTHFSFLHFSSSLQQKRLVKPKKKKKKKASQVAYLCDYTQVAKKERVKRKCGQFCPNIFTHFSLPLGEIMFWWRRKENV